MKHENLSKALVAGFLFGMMIPAQVFAMNQEISCPEDTPDGSHCWQCGSNCYATLTGTTMNITGSGALDAPVIAKKYKIARVFLDIESKMWYIISISDGLRLLPADGELG